MRVAICLAGKVGSARGKSDDAVDSARVLEIAAERWRSSVIEVNRPRPDVYIHCWDVALRDQVVAAFEPVDVAFESQRVFDIPAHVPGTDAVRKQAHWSRWYSAQQAAGLALRRGGYDLVMLARFDLFWRSAVLFDALEVAEHEVLAPGWWRSTRLKVMDVWLLARPWTMAKLVELYDHLEDYTNPSGGARFKGYVSSHRLLAHHCRRSGIAVREWRRYDEDPSRSDFPVVRDAISAGLVKV